MQESIIEKYLFSSNWMEEFKNIWNSPENFSAQSAFANSDEVLFVMGDDKTIIRSTLVKWGKDGKMSFICEPVNNNIIPSFIAPPEAWEAVIYSYYSTIQAVVNAKMEFRGKMRFATSFSQRFSMIADVAIVINRMFMRY